MLHMWSFNDVVAQIDCFFFSSLFQKFCFTHTQASSHAFQAVQSVLYVSSRRRTYILATKLWVLLIHLTASLTISSTIALAGFFSLTTAEALPMRNGRALSRVSSSTSSPICSMSCSTGILPFPVSSLISSPRLSSQLAMYGLLRTRSGRPYLRSALVGLLNNNAGT